MGVWEFTGDLFVTGNFAWGSSIDGFKPSTVMDAVRVDGSTIIKKKDSNGDWISGEVEVGSAVSSWYEESNRSGNITQIPAWDVDTWTPGEK